MPLRAKIKQTVELHRGFLELNRYVIEAEQHGGGVRELNWELMVRGNAVAVLGYDPLRDQVVLVNELRPGALIAGEYPYTDNLVAGAMERDESPIDAAIREMQEETGLALRDPVVIHPGAYVSSGGTSEKIAIVVGTVDASTAGGVHGNPQESEDILTVVLSADEFIRRVHAAEITDLKTIVAAYWLADHRRESPPSC